MSEAADIRREVQERVEAEARTIPAADGSGDTITPQEITRCLVANELGDGILYARLFRDRFLFNKNAGEWFEWSGHIWRRDIWDRSLAAVEQVAGLYLREYGRTAEHIGALVAAGDDNAVDLKRLFRIKKDLLRRVAMLRTAEKRRPAVLKFSHTMQAGSLAVTGDEFDNRPMLFPCANGVLDLETGVLRPGRRDDFLTKGSPVEFRGIDEPAPIWNRSLIEIFGGDGEQPPSAERNESAAALAGYFLRLCGYAMTGLVNEKVFPVLYGKTGWNGRSLLMEAVAAVFGDMARTIPAEMLLSQKFSRSGAAPTPDIMGLKGIRLAIASEIDENQRFSAARIKWLTGRDTLVGRNPHDKFQTTFKPTHKLFLMTNTQPTAPAGDRSFWERMALIPFSVSFVNRDPFEPHERRALLDLDQRLQREAPGILASILKGCLAWQRDGLNPPAEVLAATEQYRKNEDTVGDFLAENCTKEPYGRERASILYGRFVEWFHTNHGQKEPSGTWFGRQLSNKFEKVRINGVVHYVGLALR